MRDQRSGHDAQAGTSPHGRPAGRGERPIGFFLAPDFSMLPFISAIEPLRVANRLAGRALYSWHVFSIDGAPVAPTSGIEVAAEAAIDSITRFPVVIVCGPHDPKHYREERVFAWLRRLAKQGTELGALDTGSYLLARARLLEGRRCTTHWETIPGFREAFPSLEVTSELFELDRGRFTCGGGTAALDMMLTRIAAEQGRTLATAVSDMFLHEVIREAGAPQRMSLRVRTGVSQPRLLEALRLMESHIEQPLLPEDLARCIGVSKRQLERLFRRHLGATPSQHYMRLRLEHGRRLLEQTALPIVEVALACGFASPGHFSHRFRTLFGCAPREARGPGGRGS